MSEQWKHPLAKRYTSPNGVYYLADEIDPEIDKLHNALAELEADIKRLKEQNDYWPMVVKVIELEQRNKDLDEENQQLRQALENMVNSLNSDEIQDIFNNQVIKKRTKK